MAEEQPPPTESDNDKIKAMEEKDALKRIETIKKLVPKSVRDTLNQIKLSKYNDRIQCNFSISESEVINKLKTEWDTYLLSNPPTDNITEYVNNNKQNIWHSFWDLTLNSIFIYCKTISNEIFSNASDIQLCNTLNKTLNVCILLDILHNKNKSKILLLKKETVINNINLQKIINDNIGSKLDIIKWKSDGSEDKKIYKQYCAGLQKEAQKGGKDFVKLYKLYKLKKIKERKALIQKKEQEEDTKISKEEMDAENEPKEVIKDNTKDEIKDEPKEIVKDERKEESKEEIIKDDVREFKDDHEMKDNIANQNGLNKQDDGNNNMQYLMILTVIIIIFAILFKVFGKSK